MADLIPTAGFLPRGGSTDFLTPSTSTSAMDYGTIGKLRQPRGTGTMIILDDRPALWFRQNLMEFFARNPAGSARPVATACPGLRPGAGRYRARPRTGPRTWIPWRAR